MGGDELNNQFLVFKDCLARRIISQAATDVSPDTSDLDDFTSYLALEAWLALPPVLHNASHDTRASIPELDTLPLHSTPMSFSDTLVSYGLSADVDASLEFLRKTLENYLREACAPPPVWSWTRTTECEICEREVPLTYHHLIPRSTHAKALKKKWHAEAILNSVAWLCRPCHSAVHHVATNEELACTYYTVDLLLAREDMQRWRKYASKQRYGVRR